MLSLAAICSMLETALSQRVIPLSRHFECENHCEKGTHATPPPKSAGTIPQGTAREEVHVQVKHALLRFCAVVHHQTEATKLQVSRHASCRQLHLAKDVHVVRCGESQLQCPSESISAH